MISADTAWGELRPVFLDSIQQTLVMVSLTLLIGGLLGLALGVLLHTTRSGGILAHRPVYTVLNVLVNLVRPIPFIILITAIGPLTMKAMGTTIGIKAATFALIVAATFGISRIVEQNLVSVDPGVVEAAQSMGASPWRIIRTVLVPEALGPLILGFTFAFVAVVDMSAAAVAINGGGLGQFAISYGYQRFNWGVTWAAVAAIVVIVQVAQFAGLYAARRVMRR
ncbi:methionine ABC transporter permease [Luteipulveratus halotolerans]|uniref:Methionine ABC transporter ATP-binding protein n=1 Tax=Luteipulveratus halotolerans TaxID=1631356 RepID=A0A0L6CER5_9MICO|nr:methionine ABC transporter permease [Luteipulveratus halotolerans]KNX36307.1 methionine ABC transporter ATP-binding protein [Luteipulveratus halotolerans]